MTATKLADIIALWHVAPMQPSTTYTHTYTHADDTKSSGHSWPMLAFAISVQLRAVATLLMLSEHAAAASHC